MYKVIINELANNEHLTLHEGCFTMSKNFDVKNM